MICVFFLQLLIGREVWLSTYNKQLVFPSLSIGFQHPVNFTAFAPVITVLIYTPNTKQIPILNSKPV